MRHPRRKPYRPALEPLEGRCVPAQFGVPWSDPGHLTISFAPDGTDIAGRPSDLFGALDATQPAADWQQQILRAFQAWAVVANINFAVVPDDGAPFGTPGPDQGDKRFGDIRIGALPLSPESVSISVPHDPFLSGTLSGDVLLNSRDTFGPGGDDLTAVLLHEVGHVLGLDESADPASVLFPSLDNAKTSLAPSDIRAVQALYGTRAPDPFGGPGGQTSTAIAEAVPVPAGYDGSAPLVVYGDVASNGAAEVYSFRPLAGDRGPVTVRLQSAGISLLAPHLTVLDATGRVLGQAAADSERGDTVQVTLPAVSPGSTYYLEVQGATRDVFGIGSYALAVSEDAFTTIAPATLDAVLRESYRYIGPGDLQALMKDPTGVLFQGDYASDGTLAAVKSLESLGGYADHTRYQATASISGPGDVDTYTIQAPGGSPGDWYGATATAPVPTVLTVTVRAAIANGVTPRVAVLTADGLPVPAQVLANGNDTFTIQVAQTQPGASYELRVTADPSAPKPSGNYELDAQFGSVVARPDTFVVTTLGGAVDRETTDLVVNQSQLFAFLLSAEAAGAPAGTDVRLTVADAQGRILDQRAAAVGDTVGGSPLFLVPGVYRVTFTAESAGNGLLPPIAVRLRGANLTDPIGPEVDDPTLRPLATAGDSPLAGGAGGPFVFLALTAAASPPGVGLEPQAGGPGGLDGAGARLAADAQVAGPGDIAADRLGGADLGRRGAADVGGDTLGGDLARADGRGAGGAQLQGLGPAGDRHLARAAGLDLGRLGIQPLHGDNAGAVGLDHEPGDRRRGDVEPTGAMGGDGLEPGRRDRQDQRQPGPDAAGAVDPGHQGAVAHLGLDQGEQVLVAAEPQGRLRPDGDDGPQHLAHFHLREVLYLAALFLVRPVARYARALRAGPRDARARHAARRQQRRQGPRPE